MTPRMHHVDLGTPITACGVNATTAKAEIHGTNVIKFVTCISCRVRKGWRSKGAGLWRLRYVRDARCL